MYEATELTPRRVARQSGYIDWQSQPSIFKHYPDFLYRLPFRQTGRLRIAELARCVTEETRIGNAPYRRLAAPSAGNLHPVELYVQVRGVKGVLSGIYHVDALHNEYVLIAEIEGEGVEPAFGMEGRFDGLIFVLGIVPYRSEWKYGDRAVRYCFLDAGHQIGALQAAASLCDETLALTAFDATQLNRMLGFTSQEFAVAACAVGTPTDRPAKPLSPLMRVAPTDYEATTGYVPAMVAQAGSIALELSPIPQTPEAVIRVRRSARKFADDPCLACEPLIEAIRRTPSGLRAHIIDVNLQNGDSVSAMMVDQTFLKRARFIVVLTSTAFGADKLIAAGAFIHGIALLAERSDIGFTGIGAFYEARLQKYLGTKDYILYVAAAGAKHA